MAQVVLNQVSKWYALSKKEKTLAVKNVSLEVGKGEFLVLVGPSGCGKSTTLRMIAGLEDISEGTLEIDGRRMNEVEPKDRDIAMVFQNYALYPHMNVYENMAFGLKLRKHPKEEIRKRVFEAAEILGLEGILERLPKALSGGQRQRVAVGRAIVRKPKVFLFDEPLSNLDARMRVQMRLEILRLHKRLSATMIYVTHDQVEAMTMGDRIVVMKDGEIQQAAEPRELYHRPRNRFVADFIGSPAMNFFSGRLASSESGLVFQHAAGAAGPGFSTPVDPRFETALKPYRDKELELGIRPEDLALANGRAPSKLGSVFEATVEMVETLGAEALWRLSVDEKSFVIRVPSELETEEGRPVRIEAPSEKCHFFDSQTGLSLTA